MTSSLSYLPEKKKCELFLPAVIRKITADFSNCYQFCSRCQKVRRMGCVCSWRLILFDKYHRNTLVIKRIQLANRLFGLFHLLWPRLASFFSFFILHISFGLFIYWRDDYGPKMPKGPELKKMCMVHGCGMGPMFLAVSNLFPAMNPLHGHCYNSDPGLGPWVSYLMTWIL